MNVESITNSGTFSVLSLGERQLKGTGLKGVIAIDKGTTNVTLQGSLDNSTFYNIETFSADTIKEITLVPYLRVNGDATGSAATIDNTTVKLFFHSGSHA